MRINLASLAALALTITMPALQTIAKSGKTTLFQSQGDVKQNQAETFAEAMATTRRNLIEKSVSDTSIKIIQSKLLANFPDACTEFLEITGSQPDAYLTAPGNSWNLEQAQRLMELVTEYKPLTEGQWARLSEAERTQWREIGELETRFARLEAMGQAGSCDVGWIETILEAGQRIVHRPVKHEAVAPYVKPYTPNTQDYSAREADERLKQDWLHQADGSATPERIKNEIAWTRDAAARIARDHGGKVDFSKELAELKNVETRMTGGIDETLYFAVRRIKRKALRKLRDSENLDKLMGYLEE